MIEKLVTNLDISTNLASLFVKQESLFFWKEDGGEPYLIPAHSRYIGSKGQIIASAFTVTELGWILAPHIETAELPNYLQGESISDAFDPNYWGRVLVYLLENKKITL